MSIKSKLIQIKNTALRPYFQLRQSEPVWNILNRESRKKWQMASGVSSDIQNMVAQAMSQDGIAIVHLDDLFPGQQLLAQMQAKAQALEASAVPNQKKTFLTQLTSLYSTLDLSDPFTQFALSSEVLGCVSGYLKMWPKLYYYTLGVTQPVEPGEAPRQSQCWHRDPEDRKMCKVFVYLNDVDETSGPFTYAKGSTYGHKWGKLFPQKPPHGNYPPQGEVERHIPKDQIQVCIGRAGTVVFADTSGLHKGGYATQKQRIMSTTGFVTQACTRGVFFLRPENFDRLSEGLSPIAKHALKNKKIANRKWKY